MKVSWDYYSQLNGAIKLCSKPPTSQKSLLKSVAWVPRIWSAHQNKLKFITVVYPITSPEEHSESPWMAINVGKKIIEGSLKSNFRQYGQVKSRDGKSQREEKSSAKHISKSKCTKHTSSGPLLEVEMSKKCTPLWREARLQVKKLKNISRSEHFWALRCRKSVHRCGEKHVCKWKS